MEKSSVFESELAGHNNALAYDKAFKQLFSRKSILSVLLKHTVPCYADMEPADIEKYIKSDSINTLNAETLSQENVVGDNSIIYDIVIKCCIPNEARDVYVELLFDLEMQRMYKTGKYDLVDRAVYYVSRLLASQPVKNSKYSALTPVYSTWICLNGIPKNLQNTVHHIQMQDLSSVPVASMQSLLNIDLLLLSEEYDWDENDATIVKFLQAVFKNNMKDTKFNPYVEVKMDMAEDLQRLKQLEEEWQWEKDFYVNEAREETREEAREEGALNKEANLVHTMYEKTQDVSQIAFLTDISEDKIRKILGL